MTSRREFLKIGIMATAWPLASNLARAAGTGSAAVDSVSLYKVIYDRRFPAGVTFAARAGMLGLPVHAIEGDMTRVWYDDLYHAWKRGRAAIAGLTAHGPLFCFEQLGREQGLRVVFQAEHRLGDGGVVEHRLSGPLKMLDAAMTLGEVGAQWGARMAEIVAHCPTGRSQIAEASVATRGCHHEAEAESLHSWLLAPAVRA